jgi:hypothetical protein
MDLRTSAQLATWPTPNTPSGGRSVSKMSATWVTLDGRKHTVSLEHVAKFATWPTPTAQDQIGSGVKDYPPTATHYSGTTLTDAANLAGWPTTRETDGEKNVRTPEGAAREMARKGGPQDLNQAATLATWATPTSRDHKDGSYQPNVPENALLGRQVWQAPSGPMSSGSPAATAKRGPSRGSLNPFFSLFLMGFPVSWGLTGIRSCPTSKTK